MILALQDVGGTVFNSPSLPNSGLTLANFTSGNATFLQLQYDNGQGLASIARGDLTYLTSNPVTPVSEPTTYAMLLAGLGVMGFILRCKKTA